MPQSSDEIRDLIFRSFKTARQRQRYLNVVERLDSANLPIIFSLQHLADLIEVNSEFLSAMTRRGNEFYRTFEVAKHGGGVRQIAAPLPSLALVQQWIATHIVDKLPISDCIPSAYQKGKSIKDHVFPHRNKSVLLKTDIKNFFPSISRDRVAKLFIDCGYPGKVASELSFLVTRDQTLPQGAPSSPAISNAVCRDLDGALASICNERGLVCTRYADDIAISGENIDGMVEIVKSTLLAHGFEMNLGKTRVYEKGMHGRFLTGLVINGDQVRLPRASRRRIRQTVFYLINYFHRDINSNFSVNSDKNGKILPQLDPLSFERIRGRLLFWRWVEPENPYPEKALQELAEVIAGVRTDNS